MEQMVKTLKSSTFVRHNAVFFFGSMSIGLLNYLYYPVMGRLLHPASFGEVQVLFSLFAQITIFLAAFGLLTVNIVANYADTGKRNRMISELEKFALLISLILLILTAIFAPVLQSFFHFGSAVPFVILMLAVVVGVPTTFRNSYLRGKQKFGIVSTAGVVMALADLILSAVLVLAGYGTVGAISALVLAQLIMFGYSAKKARTFGFTESLHGKIFKFPDFRLMLPELRYALLVLIGSLTITAMYSLDSLAVKHFFNAREAGVYAGISTVGRIIFFLTASIVGVLIPSIKLKQKPKQNQDILQKSLLLMVTIGGMALLVFAVMPKFVTRILMGPKYLPDAYLLPRLSLVIFIISLLNLFIMYHIALRRYWILAIVLLGFTATLSLLAANHQTIMSVINSLLIGSVSMLVLLGMWLGINKLKTQFAVERG